MLNFKSPLQKGAIRYSHGHMCIEVCQCLLTECSVYLKSIQSGPALVCACCLTPKECVARLISRAAGLLGCTGGGQSLRLSRAQPRHVSAHISLF